MPRRRTEDAIEIARNAGMDLPVAGAVKDTNYFGNEIRPKMDGSKIKYLGEVAPDWRNKLLIPMLFQLSNYGRASRDARDRHQ
jgi:hypothetical protein